MIGCRIKKMGRQRVIYMIIDHGMYSFYPSTRPATNEEINEIQNREARKQMDEIIKEYNETLKKGHH